MGNNAKSKKEEALLYHSEGRPGKIEVIPTKPYSTQKDLSLAVKIAKAVEILHFQYPDLLVDGEMKADIALNKQARNEFYPFNKLGDREINVLIFPNLSSANISYKMMEILGGAEINGPILMGLNRSCVHLIPEVASTRAIRNLSVIAAAETIPSK